MSDSLLSNEKQCYVCGTTYNLHRHHIFGGGRRNASERYGAWVYLCAEHHNMSDEGVHFNHELDTFLKTEAQRKLEKVMSRDEFREHFGRSLL